MEGSDEIWHAGDIGSIEIIEKLKSIAPLRGVYGNIDGTNIRAEFPENNFFRIEETDVLMRHICGTPPTYNADCRVLLEKHKPKLLVCGHSHILRIQFDPSKNCLFMNPGAAGKQGWHKKRTLIKFVIDAENFKDCKIVELAR
jgi:hypothetical protein